MKVDSHFHGFFHSAVTDTLEDGMLHFLNDKGLDAALVQKQNKKLGHKICQTFCPLPWGTVKILVTVNTF